MRIYLDHNATTPLRPEVREAMERVLRDEFGNPSSVAFEGARARTRVEQAREQVASLLSVAPADVRFTSGATEANNTVLMGLLSPSAYTGGQPGGHIGSPLGSPLGSHSVRHPGNHVVTTQIEHPSVSAPLESLATRGLRVAWMAPDALGCVPVAALEAAITQETRLVTVIWANNETGAIQPIEALAAICHARGIWLHADATQAIGKLEIDLAKLPLDSIACSAHKLGGPKGVGALVARDQAAIPPLLLGGGQERGRRGGTENTIGIAGFGAACAVAAATGASQAEMLRTLRDRLWQGIQQTLPGVRWNGDPVRTLPNTLNVEFASLAGEVLLQALDLEGVAVSAGAACHSGSIEPSKILVAMGRTPEQARGSLRFSLGFGIDAVQIERTIELLSKLVPRIRALGEP